jgi:hypothetical protein
VLPDGAAAPVLRVQAREAGPAGATLSIRIDATTDGRVTAVVNGSAGARTYNAGGGFADLEGLVAALNADPEIRATALGPLLPAATAAALPLTPTRTLTVRLEGERTARYEDQPDASALVTAAAADPSITLALAPGATATQLPDAGTDNEVYLTGGRAAGLARSYAGQTRTGADDVVIELVPTPGTAGEATRFQMLAGSRPSTVRLVVGVDAGGGFEEREVHDNLSMDPDSDRYLPSALAAGSGLVRALDQFRRSRARSFPASTAAPARLAGGRAPILSAWEGAIDALGDQDAVDLVLAGLQEWKDTALDGVEVQRAMLAHARTQADTAKPRIVLGSIRPADNRQLRNILGHAQQIKDRRMILAAPSGVEGALAGLLGHLEFFQSPTYKTVASPGVPLVPYSEGELNQMLGTGGICAVVSRRGLGTVCLKGIFTDGFQISVVRIADRCIREVKAISQGFIGELNNGDARNALKQMIVATFSQLERDGALVPSTDGTQPAFLVDVYSSQNDFAGGIVRVDIAVRPVRAIDYIYATIQVKN